MLTNELLKDLDEFLNMHLPAATSVYSTISATTGSLVLGAVLGGAVACTPNPILADLEKFVDQNKSDKFFSVLTRIISAKNMNETEVYHKAGIDRKTFSKMRSNRSLSKENIIALALALELEHDETTMLLASADISLNNSSLSDLIIQFCIERKIYDLFTVNELLGKYNLQTISFHLT